jgi:uncharacterized membrane protein YsdA (DUF1294 family)/cold shock CspA family protein
MRFEGTLKTWNDERGFGFIEPKQGGPDLFVHIKALPIGVGRPSVGDRLTFEVERGTDGKQRACAVQYADQVRRPDARRPESPAAWTLLRKLALSAFVGVWGYAAAKWGFQSPIVEWRLALGWYVMLSLATFLVYVFDKSAAVRGRWRTAESTLHLLSLAGGWPGALLAQQQLRHKTSKFSFILVFWITVLINMAGLVGWCSGVFESWIRQSLRS